MPSTDAREMMSSWEEAVLVLRKNLFEEIVKHLRDELPNEGCGILAGKDGVVMKVYRIANVERSPTSFLMDPREQLDAMKEIRESGSEIVGIYHSHVASPAYPSERDVQMALYPDVTYLIVSFQNSKRPRARAFRIAEGEIEEEALLIRGGEGYGDKDLPERT
jgi:proteasome lid subunit RPN8/RPN11